MEFKLWSELSKQASEELKPNFGFRSWDVLSELDKRKIWRYLEKKYFFDTDVKGEYGHRFANVRGLYYEFHGEYSEQDTKQKRIGSIIITLNDLYKAKSYAKNFLESPTYTESCTDFYSIFIKENSNVVLELFSLYAKHLLYESETSTESLSKAVGESTQAFKKRVEEQKTILFDEFAEDINEIFAHFGLNLYLTRLGFAPRQEEKIDQYILKPVLKSLAHEKWKEVNQNLSDAFADYRKNTPNGYSACVTKTVSAIQAFLQILVFQKTGTGDISKLIV